MEESTEYNIVSRVTRSETTCLCRTEHRAEPLNHEMNLDIFARTFAVGDHCKDNLSTKLINAIIQYCTLNHIIFATEINVVTRLIEQTCDF